MKKTKIVCSIGPASNEPDVMEKMVRAGMNVARINFSHATIEEREKACASVREVRKRTGMNVAILWDTKGPEFRCGIMENDSIELVPGETIDIVKEPVTGTKERFSVNHPSAIDSLNVGDIILLENAKMKLEVIAKYEDRVTCKIISGGTLGNRKSMSVPGIKLDIPFVSEEDRNDIIYACEHGGEFLALSFVSTKEDVLEVKEILKEHNREDLQIICKIESALGIENLEDILSVSDGVMVARGDLGTEVPSEMVPIYQKQMINTCRRLGKISIVATEMLETMMANDNIRPKRAETSDIANAVLDGTDAVMLSGETTVGKHPVETVAAMASICETTEKYASFDYAFDIESLDNITKSIASNVVLSTDALGAKLICAATISGRTARVISNLKPDAPILALCTDEKTGRRLALNWGVYAGTLPFLDTTDEVLTKSVEKAKEFMELNEGDLIVITGGFPNTETKRITNLMKIEEI
ncbi:MAG TPA: pyruvate kinase [Candidatus Onthousia excrementipullorum]|uniref:Pyruvate kinase n=1 Tax=Candidatus Onthousia excrementipullorum TaxID=2840884 RepID=A0A9D1DTB1_9FIRM|nr:pyruvate kinase [Candidatus Onthousia excrementipullorum]